MGFGDKSVLTARYSDENSYLNDISPDKVKELGSQVDDLIFQKTGIAVPDKPADAIGTLRGVWCDIVLFKLIPYQSKLADEEKSRRKSLYNDAMSMLTSIERGDTVLKDSAGSVISSTQNVIQIEGTKRITRVL